MAGKLFESLTGSNVVKNATTTETPQLKPATDLTEESEELKIYRSLLKEAQDSGDTVMVEAYSSLIAEAEEKSKQDAKKKAEAEAKKKAEAEAKKRAEAKAKAEAEAKKKAEAKAKAEAEAKKQAEAKAKAEAEAKAKAEAEEARVAAETKEKVAAVIAEKNELRKLLNKKLSTAEGAKEVVLLVANTQNGLQAILDYFSSDSEEG